MNIKVQIRKAIAMAWKGKLAEAKDLLGRISISEE